MTAHSQHTLSCTIIRWNMTIHYLENNEFSWKNGAMTILCLKLLCQCNDNDDYDVSHCVNQSWTNDVDYDAISRFPQPHPLAQLPANVEHSSVLISKTDKVMNFYSLWLSPKELSLVMWTLKQSGEGISPWLPLEILGPDVLISSFDRVWGDEPNIFKLSCQCWKALGTQRFSLHMTALHWAK